MFEYFTLEKFVIPINFLAVNLSKSFSKDFLAIALKLKYVG